MKYFLDSAKIDEIRFAYENWGIDGVTTNPKHVYASGKPFKAVLADLGGLADEWGIGADAFPISVEIDPYLDDAGAMAEAAREYAALAPNFCIKVPCTGPGLAAAKRLESEGIRTNVTLVFSPSQALQAGRIGARFVSPFVGWPEASGDNGMELVREVAAIYENYAFETEIIVAAARNGRHIADAALAGADIITAGFGVYEASFAHPFTDYGLKVFQDAWDKIDHG